MLDKLGACEGRIEAAFSFFLRKRAPVSGLQSLLDYRGRWIAEARGGVIKPTDEFALPGGGTRLSFAQGSYGKETYMLDFDAKGVLVSSRQVLTEENFATIVPGMPAAEVRT